MNTQNSWLNGIPADAIAVSDRGLAYGHGVFETLLVTGGVIPLLDRHLARAVVGGKILGIDVDEKLLKEYVLIAIDGHHPVQPPENCSALVVKVIVTAGEGPRGYRASAGLRPNYIVQAFDYQQPRLQEARQGLRLYPCATRLPCSEKLAGIKHLNRLEQVLAASEFNAEEYDDGLMLDEQNRVIETLSRNLFIKLASGQWATPSLQKSGVAGVMRGFLLDKVFPQAGLDVSVEQITAKALQSAHEVFACNSIIGIQPVVSLGSSDCWSVGDETKRLMEMLGEACRCYS